MDDKEIVALFWNRDENAIKILKKEYEDKLIGLSYRILGNMEDVEECVNDTFLNVWNSIPDERPDFLFSYCAKITRNLSINRLKRNTSIKRGGNDVKIVFSELEECICDHETVESIVEYRELSKLISEFLATLKQEQRTMFVERYWYVESVKNIAMRHRCSIKKVESILLRTRRKLKKYLEKRGWFNE